MLLVCVCISLQAQRATLRIDAQTKHQRITGFGGFVCSPQFGYGHMTQSEIKKVWGADGASYISSSEQTYNGKNFLIFSFVYQGTYNDAILTELPDGTLLCVVAYYNDLSSKTEGYNNLAKFVKSAVKDTNSSFSGDSKVEFKSSSIEKID